MKVGEGNQDMSTVKSKRRVSLLKAEVLAVELLKKTIEVCSSKNNFPIRKKWAIPSDLYLEAREFCVDLCLANDIKVEDRRTAMERLKLGDEAKMHIERYIKLNNIAVLAYPIGESTIDSWLSLMNEAYEMFNKWRSADAARYREYMEE